MTTQQRRQPPKCQGYHKEGATVKSANVPSCKKKRTILLKTAREIAMDWHSGMWSALYSFGSTGILSADTAGRALTEIGQDLEAAETSKKQAQRLLKLKGYITGNSCAEGDLSKPEITNQFINH